MQHLETSLLIAEADRVLCHLVMFLTTFFVLDEKMKYSCYQDPSVIHGWFVYWVLVEKFAACQSNRKSDFGWHISLLTSPCLACYRSDIVGSAELKKRKQENKMGGNWGEQGRWGL